jgi:tetratricopeptide (TPR) repeat protein
MKKFPVILISLIIAVSLAVMVILLVEPYREKRHERLAEPLFKEAAVLYRSGRYAAALDNYRTIVDKYQKSSYTFESLQRTVDIYGRYNRRDDKYRYLKKFAENFPRKDGSAPYIYELAQITFMLKGDKEKALQYYNMVIDNFPDTVWAPEAEQRAADIALRELPPAEAVQVIDGAISKTEDERRLDYLRLRKIEFLWKEGRVREAYEVTAEISRPLKDFVRDNLVFNQLIVREEPSYENLQSLARVYDLRGFSGKAEEIRMRARRIREGEGR